MMKSTEEGVMGETAGEGINRLGESTGIITRGGSDQGDPPDPDPK